MENIEKYILQYLPHVEKDGNVYYRANMISPALGYTSSYSGQLNALFSKEDYVKIEKKKYLSTENTLHLLSTFRNIPKVLREYIKYVMAENKSKVPYEFKVGENTMELFKELSEMIMNNIVKK